MGITVETLRGWELVRVESAELAVEVLPDKGGDILAAVPSGGPDVLWKTPWGVRAAGASATGGSSTAHVIQAYPGGWQTVFPNAGDECEEHGVTWGFHGEVWLTPFDWRQVGAQAIELTTRLVRSPFAVTKRIQVDGDTVSVTESVRNEGRVPIEVMWSHHPAFGAPLVGAGCRLDTNATRFVVDDVRDMPRSDLELGAESEWPKVPARDGSAVDLREVPGADATVDRMGYLTDFDGAPWATLTNPTIGVTARLEWDATVMPHAWYWCEAHATDGFPWFGAAHVLAIEPASSFPGQGLATVRRTTGTQLVIEPGETRTASVRLSARVT